MNDTREDRIAKLAKLEEQLLAASDEALAIGRTDFDLMGERLRRYAGKAAECRRMTQAVLDRKAKNDARRKRGDLTPAERDAAELRRVRRNTRQRAKRDLVALEQSSYNMTPAEYEQRLAELRLLYGDLLPASAASDIRLKDDG